MNSQTISQNITTEGKYIPSKNSFSPLSVPKNEFEQITQFASGIAHELRNPLSNINLSVEMLKCTSKENDQMIYLDIINRSSARVNELVIDFLRSFKDEEKQAQKYSIHPIIHEDRICQTGQ
jgi:signal transduction histidine kinase